VPEEVVEVDLIVMQPEVVEAQEHSLKDKLLE